MRNCKARSGRKPGSRVTGAGPHTRSRDQEQTGQADGAHHPAKIMIDDLLWWTKALKAARTTAA
jgi:hypothetical protein